MTKNRKTPRHKNPAQFMHEGNKKHRAVRTYLADLAASERKQEALKESIERENAKRYLVGASTSERVSITSEPDLVGEGFIRLQEKIEAMNTELVGYVDVSEDMRKALFAIADSPSFDVIWQRYFIGLAWSDVAKVTGYSEIRCYQLHNKAIEEMYEHLPAEYRQQKTIKYNINSC